ncbi:hypothetical protein [Treponema brennaborense]|uniref:Uncharacterized protein n=1 Tax=Treponema brennaborense (strain DSM 12168 / CIP 105900 / DD5/3) TaxID=906968 RepID=F4LK13_TREBD|nr:hypothetical protein [Treponema brennaborense]AEE17475.1 hypothetical protein Trebr_2060 [Treponema brennaborense DSM 12168]
MFAATSLEKQMLQLIASSAIMSKRELLSQFENPAAAEKALEGCMVKNFVSKKTDSDSNPDSVRFILTKAGLDQL